MEKINKNSKINSRITSLQFSDLGTYTIDYLGNGNINTITYPNSQGEETYTYGEGKGRLSQIEYPNNDTLEFQWNDKDEITRIDYTVYATQIETRYTMTYTPNHQVATLTQSIDSVQQYVWTFSWAPNGLEKSVKSVNGQPVLTQDYTTDLQGRILSMTYDTAGEAGYDGELYFHYDHFGNTTLLTDTNGDPVASFEYDLHSGMIVNEWNPSGLEVMNLKASFIFLINLGNMQLFLNKKLQLLSYIKIDIKYCKSISISSLQKIQMTSSCDPCEGKKSVTFMAYGDWDRIPKGLIYELIPWEEASGEQPISEDPLNFEYTSFFWKPLEFRNTLVEKNWDPEGPPMGKDKLRIEGYSETFINKASDIIGNAFADGCQRVSCDPVTCPDGSCGLSCTCNKDDGSGWNSFGEDICP